MSNGIVTSREIGAAIRKRRKELGLSQEQLAEKAGVSYQQLQRYENGGSMLNVENVQRIAQSLQIPVSHLFTTTQPHAVAEQPPHYAASDEKNILKHFRNLRSSADKSMAMALVRRLARS
ncbi:MAG: helix-turn-helix transcriptional regulator [Desulfuromonadales bacterium]